MKLDELLDKPVEFKILQDEDHAFYTSFVAGGREIQFFANNEGAEDGDDEGEWMISFGELQTKKRVVRLPGQSATYSDLLYGKTGSGNELEVFSTLKAIIEKFIKSRRPKKIMFTADKDAKNNRSRVYAKLFKKNLPQGWKITKDESPASHEPVFFALVREGKPDLRISD